MGRTTKEEIIDILDKMEFFQGQRAGRELWNNKPKEVQDKDIENFNRNIQKIRDYVLSYDVEAVVKKLDKASDYYELDEQGREHVQMIDLVDAIEIVRRGGANEK